NPYIRRGLERAGFTGGWLSPPGEAADSGEPDPEAAAVEDIGIAQSRAHEEEEKPPAEPRASDPPQWALPQWHGAGWPVGAWRRRPGRRNGTRIDAIALANHLRGDARGHAAGAARRLRPRRRRDH